MARVLFILKLRDEYGYSYGGGISSGLYNSARFVVEMLERSGIEAKLVQVVDNNDIDREVAQYAPSHVVIEALWVVPEKFDILVRLHPTVRWIVRNHSEIPFLAQEGVALDWYARYVRHPHVAIASNSRRGFSELLNYIAQTWFEGENVGDFLHHKVLYLPNYYPARQPGWNPRGGQHTFHAGCFGAIRVLKNQLLQAMAAGNFAASRKKQLVFHLTAGGTNDWQANSIVRNLQAYCDHTGNLLVIHAWKNHADFLKLVATMDVVMQVSFSETFDIVAADAVSLGVPVVVSREIQWASVLAQVNTTNAEAIATKIDLVTEPFTRAIISNFNRRGLEHYSHESREVWLDYLRK